MGNSTKEQENIETGQYAEQQENPFDEVESQRYQQQLEEQVVQLQQQVSQLEEALKKQQSENPESEADRQQVKSTTKLTVENLVAAGASEVLANDIIQRKDQFDYLLLELQDRARREGYINKPRYFRERRDLMSKMPSLRDMLDRDVYDRYLYSTGQNNRVVVTSVMSGSPAQQLGVQKNDIIISYANQKPLNSRELKELTGKGNYGDYVNLTLLRNEQLLNVLVPRGPLGVRLATIRLDPGIVYSY